MSKVGGALPSWYWPAGIPRRVPVAQQPLGRILRQRFTAAGSKPAIVSGGHTISYAGLSQRVIAIAGGLQASSLKGGVAIVDSDPSESLVLLLSALFAGRQTYLPEFGADDPATAAHLVEAKVAALLTSSADAPHDGLPVLRAAELAGNFNEAASPRRANEPGVLLSGERGVVTHSHFSLSAMAASMAAFIPKLRETAFVCTGRSLGSWEMLTGILLALLGGMPVFFGTVEAGAPSPAPAYVILDRTQADRIVAENRAPDLVRSASHVFVSTGSFASRWRRQLESLCGAPVFPIWGVPELGPVLASHPTWLPPHGHGFPLVNVSLIPIDPATGRVSIVPWEMLERAEMGVEALSAMIGYAEPSRNAAAKSGTALRTRQIASMDHVGVVVLQDGAGGDAARA